MSMLSMQADELRKMADRLGVNGVCMGDVWFRCTNCDTTYDYYADDWLMKQNYCPHCGFKVRKAAKR